jgi:phosphoserine aminotransferase
LGIGDEFEVLLLGGGATLQFGMVPLNFLPKDKSCAFVVSGSWAKKAIADAQKTGSVHVLFDGKESDYTTLPDPTDVSVSDNHAYLHITSNETIGGVQWKTWPDTGSVPLVVDMSSDILSREIPMEKFDLIYAGAQKNLGPAGVTVVIIKKALVDRCPDTLPAYLSYKTHAEKNSLYNTPPVFAIFAMKLVLEWVKIQGGAAALAEVNDRKAALIYDAINDARDFYSCPVDERYRSTMNVVFRLPNEDLEKRFVAEALNEGMVGLKGHRSVGGCRASLYNAMPLEGAEKLASFMREFAKKNK